MRSWKTTLAGVLAGIAITVGGAVQNRANDPSQPPVTVGNVLPGIAIALLGALAKDSDVSHSPTPLPKAESVDRP